jgi:protein tyrosine phosphatase
VIVTIPDGTFVNAGGRLGLVPFERVREPDFALYLDGRWEGDPQVTWPYRVIAWPDFGLPENVSELFAVVRQVHGRAIAGELVEVACYGGLGRTGTLLGCLAIVAGVHAVDAVEWVRGHYDARAVETVDQIEMIARFS